MTIDYQIGIINCPKCGSEIEVPVTYQQDNRTCEVDVSWPHEIDCPYCDRKDIRITKRNLRR
jgi:DNA-directed RNA polymerase subunit RPC12/RpoP